MIPWFDSTLVTLRSPKLYHRRVDPAERISGDYIWPQREPGSYQSLVSRIRSAYLDKDTGLKRSVHVDFKREFRDAGIQVIIQVSSIDPTPEEPNYPGQEWHVQGQLACMTAGESICPLLSSGFVLTCPQNERICASVVYCYNCENILNASMSFRSRVSNEEPMWLNTVTETTMETEDMYDIEDLTPAVQELGDLTIQENRVISFLNVRTPPIMSLAGDLTASKVFQTKLNSFSLQDESKPGHCKLMIVHLVDPNRRIMSTSNVPCQRRDWWAHEIRENTPVLWRLPVEIFNHIIDMSYYDESESKPFSHQVITRSRTSNSRIKLTATVGRRRIPDLPPRRRMV